MTELEKYIEEKTESINCIGITDSISEGYLKEICEGYCELKNKPHLCQCKSDYGFTMVGGYTYCQNCGERK